VGEEEISPEERAIRAEAALAETLEERNRLWNELQANRSDAHELEHWRGRTAEIEASRWWRAGAPLRLASKVIRDPGMAVKVLSWRLSQARRGR